MTSLLMCIKDRFEDIQNHFWIHDDLRLVRNVCLHCVCTPLSKNDGFCEGGCIFVYFETCLVFCVCKIAKPPKVVVMVVATRFAMSVCHIVPLLYGFMFMAPTEIKYGWENVKSSLEFSSHLHMRILLFLRWLTRRWRCSFFHSLDEKWKDAK